MVYPDNFEEKIGFTQICRLLESYCISRLGQQHITKISFSSALEEISEKLYETEEFRQILLSPEPFPQQDYFDLTPEFSRIKIPGTFIEIQSLVDLRLSLNTINLCAGYFRKAEKNLYPTLRKLAEEIMIDPAIISYLDKLLDEKGKIRDNASPGLAKIRKELNSRLSQIDRMINKALASAKSEGITPDDVEVTIRNGRMVIPVLAQNKRMIRGFIHDESSTGQTVYIEPAEVFDVNNEIRDLENAEKREIIKILTAFTDFLRPYLGDLHRAYIILGKLDFIRAKARLALHINAVLPQIVNEPHIDWIDAVHPLLHLSHKARKMEVVPLNIRLDRKQRILVISGPNAGGKSVCLKTVGLLQYMLQCGLLIPLQEHSRAGLFKDIFIDIGDDQSLENDLSTYSSHLRHLRFFLENAGPESLFLIDEFGTGTEPQLGGAIAEASLERLNEKKAFGIVTTHYANLKLLSGEQEGIINGAMLFDTREMRPLFQLLTGKPGSSFAFEIAGKIGFPADVLEKASLKTGKSQLDFDKQLQQLEVEKEEIIRQRQEFTVADTFLSEMIEKYQKLVADLEAKKKDILEKAREEALDIVKTSNRLVENTIREIRESNAEKEKTKEARKILEEHKEAIEKPKPEPRVKKIPKKPVRPKPSEDPIVAGDMVKLKNHNAPGEVVEIRGKMATVFTGSMKLNIPLDQLEKSDQKNIKPFSANRKYGQIVNDLNEKHSRFSLSIDLRGKRAEEALGELGRYIDDALLLGIREFSIIHGKGDGILRTVVRDMLAGMDEVRQYRDEHVERGGSGITIVTLK
ncbi:MAG: endonuclease MutS2 [Bacteroidetes bacterium]|nr:endonuclease MutS2 [Bacteroidota bacterium]